MENRAAVKLNCDPPRLRRPRKPPQAASRLAARQCTETNASQGAKSTSFVSNLAIGCYHHIEFWGMRVFPKIFTFLNNDARLILRGKLLRILRRQAAFSFAVVCIIMFNLHFSPFCPAQFYRREFDRHS